MNSTFFQVLHTPCRITYSGGERVPQHELLACAQCGCFAFSCFEDFAIRVNRPLNEHLSKVLPKVVEEIRRISKDEKILLIFDRGGYSGALFKSLSSQGIEFITYLKGT